MLVTSPCSLKGTAQLNPGARAGATQPYRTSSPSTGPVMSLLLSLPLAVILPEMAPHGWSQSTVALAQPCSLWGHGWGKDQIISVCFAVNPESPAPSCESMSARVGLQHWTWAQQDMPHVQKTSSSCSSLFLFRIRLYSSFYLQTTVLLKVILSTWLKIHGYPQSVLGEIRHSNCHQWYPSLPKPAHSSVRCQSCVPQGPVVLYPLKNRFPFTQKC